MTHPTPQDYAQALFGALQATDPQHHAMVLDQFVRVLADDRRVSDWSQIAEAIAAVAVERSVRLARPQELTLVTAACGDGVNVSVDPTLLGGVVIRLGDRVVDGSVAGLLQQLRRALAGGLEPERTVNC